MDFNKAYLEAQAQRMSVEAKLRELKQIAKDPAGAQTIFTVADNPLIQKLKGELSELEVREGQAPQDLQGPAPRDPQGRRADPAGEPELDAEIQNMLRAVQTEYKVAKAREETLLSNVNQLRREGQELNEKEIQYLDAAARGRVEPAALRGGAQALKETGVAGGLETNNVRVVEEASAPMVPVRPRKAWSLLPERRGGPRPRPRRGLRHRVLRHDREDARRRRALPRACP